MDCESPGSQQQSRLAAQPPPHTFSQPGATSQAWGTGEPAHSRQGNNGRHHSHTSPPQDDHSIVSAQTEQYNPHVLTNVDTTQTGSLNMQLPGYNPQYSQYTSQTFQGFPFLATTTAAVSAEPVATQTTRTANAGDESPMVGVCVQQSPVATH